MEFNYWIATEPGPIRKVNEDAVDAFEVNNTLFLIVTDGFGVPDDKPQLLTAGKIAVENIRKYIEKFYIFPGEASLKFVLSQAVYHANSLIHHFYRANKENYENYGCSLTIAAITKDKKMYTIHSGITRLYLLRNGEIYQGTQDNSEAQMLLNMGSITEDEFITHPGRMQVTKALGILNDIEINIQETYLTTGDLIILVSDGVYRTLGNPRIQALVYEAGELSMACEWLMKGSVELNSPDNISAVISHIE